MPCITILNNEHVVPLRPANIQTLLLEYVDALHKLTYLNIFRKAV